MNSLAFLVPIALLFGAVAVSSFVWSLRGGRFDDAARRVPVRDERRKR